MLDIHVDASLGRKCGCAAVVLIARAPLPTYRLALTVPLPGGLTPNEGEMAALLAAAHLYRATTTTRATWDPAELLLTAHSDSATCVRMLYPHPSERYPATRFGRLAKQAARAWTTLRDDRLCLSWAMRRIARTQNQAGPLAAAGLREWRKSF